jgi:hypothetical protein
VFYGMQLLDPLVRVFRRYPLRVEGPCRYDRLVCSPDLAGRSAQHDCPAQNHNEIGSPELKVTQFFTLVNALPTSAAGEPKRSRSAAAGAWDDPVDH